MRAIIPRRLSRFPPRCSGRDGFDNAFPQVIRIGLRHRFGPQNPESMPHDSLTHTQLGIPDSIPPESALGPPLRIASYPRGLVTLGRDSWRSITGQAILAVLSARSGLSRNLS